MTSRAKVGGSSGSAVVSFLPAPELVELRRTMAGKSERRVALPARSEPGARGTKASDSERRPPIRCQDSCNSDLTPLGSWELNAMASRQLDLLAADAKTAKKPK